MEDAQIKQTRENLLEEIRKVTTTRSFRFLKHPEQRKLILKAIEKHVSTEDVNG